MMKLYRYEASNDGRRSKLKLITLLVVKETPCGYWYIDKRQYWNQPLNDFIKKTKKWTSKTARIRKCYPTQEEAYNSFKIRSTRRIAHLERQLNAARLNVQLTLSNTTVHDTPPTDLDYFFD